MTDQKIRFRREITSPNWLKKAAELNPLSSVHPGLQAKINLPASEQFDGAGSYGNGAAMRAHPIGLFGNNIEEVEIMAEKQAKLTHAHDGGIMGSILQATGIFHSFFDKYSMKSPYVIYASETNLRKFLIISCSSCPSSNSCKRYD